MPTGDASDFNKSGFGVDVAYYFLDAVNDFNAKIENLKAGFFVGYYSYSGKTYTQILPGELDLSFKTPDRNFIPIGIATKYQISNFYLGFNGGYAVGLASEAKKGVIIQPKLGLLINESFGVTANYTMFGLSLHENNIYSINFGVEYNF